jgi:competence protein ComEA
MSRSNKVWAAVILLLVVAIAAGSISILSRYNPGQPIEITMPPSPEIGGQISVAGAVNIPDLYPLAPADSIGALLESAGGSTASADPDGIELYIPHTGETDVPQKVDLNRAEAWLLEALPGIGETRAQAIMDYRQRSGRFGHISEIIRVEGIGEATYEKIRHLITVSD